MTTDLDAATRRAREVVARYEAWQSGGTDDPANMLGHAVHELRDLLDIIDLESEQ